MPSQVELAWAAGFIDGEGHVKLQRHKNENTGPRAAPYKYKAKVTVAQVSREPLDKLQQMFGVGVVRVARQQPLIHHWCVSTAQAREVLRQIRPYLVVKADAADSVLAQVGHGNRWKG